MVCHAFLKRGGRLENNSVVSINYVNEIAEEISCEKWLFRLFHQAVLPRDRSKCSQDNENELILARGRIRGLVGIRN